MISHKKSLIRELTLKRYVTVTFILKYFNNHCIWIHSVGSVAVGRYWRKCVTLVFCCVPVMAEHTEGESVGFSANRLDFNPYPLT